MSQINFGILDPNAAAKAAGSFREGQNALVARQDADQQRQMNALALQRNQQVMADENATRQAYVSSGGDPTKLVESLKGAGQYKAAMDTQAQMTTQQAIQRKAKIDEGMQHVQILGQIAGGVKDQASYDAAKQQLVGLFGPDSIANIPAQYDPNTVAQFRTQALNAGQQLDQQSKALELQLKQAQFGFEKQKFGAEQGMKSSQFAQTQQLERDKMVNSNKIEQAKQKGEYAAQTALPQAEMIKNETIKNIDDLLNHPGFGQAVGGGIPGLKYIPGTNVSDFNARLDQIKGGAFLQARQQLKGGGAITDFEGQKAEMALTRMSTAQSEAEFKTAATDYKAAITKGYELLRSQAGMQPSGNVDNKNPLLQ